MKRFYLGDIPVDFLPKKEILEKIHALVRVRQPAQIVTLNSLMLNYALGDTELLAAIRGAALVVPDSIGIVIAALMRGAARNGARPGRIPGIDLLMDICGLAEEFGYSVFLLGSRPETIPKAAISLKEKFPDLKIAGFYHGYFNAQEEEEIIHKIASAAPDIVFVGLDIPRQEKWIFKYLPKLCTNIVMGVGGSFDVISGKLKRAPAFMRTLGLEWLFRLIQEPWRIGRILNLPVFLLRALRLK